MDQVDYQWEVGKLLLIGPETGQTFTCTAGSVCSAGPIVSPIRATQHGRSGACNFY